jgi:hypothetical protein
MLKKEDMVGCAGVVVKVQRTTCTGLPLVTFFPRCTLSPGGLQKKSSAGGSAANSGIWLVGQA